MPYNAYAGLTFARHTVSSEFGVPADLVGEFSPKETDELVEIVEYMDIDKSGKVDHKEIVAMFKAIGETASTDEVRARQHARACDAAVRIPCRH